MTIKSNVKAGGIGLNHNQNSGMKLKSNVKAGGISINHNQIGR